MRRGWDALTWTRRRCSCTFSRAEADDGGREQIKRRALPNRVPTPSKQPATRSVENIRALRADLGGRLNYPNSLFLLSSLLSSLHPEQSPRSTQGDREIIWVLRLP